MIVKKIFKYPTGAVIPENAKYLSTVTQAHKASGDLVNGSWAYEPCWLVWHYFLVEVEDNEKK